MSEKETIKVWDIFVRVFHWALVLFFIISYITGEEESSFHVYSGYVILTLISLRIVWGVIGSKYARFGNFVYPPREAIAYMKGLIAGNPKHYIGHNPAAGWMVIALLLSLYLTVGSGLMLYAAQENKGPLAGYATYVGHDHSEHHHNDDEEHEEHEEEEDEFWEEVHEVMVSLTLILIFMHIAGALLSSYVHRENLIRSMINGEKEIKP